MPRSMQRPSAWRWATAAVVAAACAAVCLAVPAMCQNYVNIAVLTHTAYLPIGLMPGGWSPSTAPDLNTNNAVKQLLGAERWRERVTELGGIPVRNTTLIPRIIWVNAGAANQTGAQALAALNAVMTNITARRYGTNDGSVPTGLHIPAVVGVPSSQSPQVAAANVAPCELHGDCVLLHTVNPQLAVYQCQLPLPAECVAKNRRAGLRRFDYGFSAQRPASQTGVDILQYLAANTPARTVVMVIPFDFAANNRAEIEAAAAAVKLSIVEVQYYRQLTTVEQAVALFANITSRNTPDIIGFWPTPSLQDSLTAPNVLKALKRMAYYPPALFLPGTWVSAAWRNDPEVAAGDLNRYVYYESVWDKTASGVPYRGLAITAAAAGTGTGTVEPWPATSEMDSPAVFYADGQERYGRAFSNSEAIGALSMSLLHKAIETAQVLTPYARDIAEGLRELSAPSHFGQLQFDTLNRLQSPLLVLQQDAGNAYRVLTPVTSKLADGVYPIPLFAEREYNPSYAAVLTASAQSVVPVLCISVGIAYAVALLCVIAYHRRHNVVVAATPVFCYLTIAGSAVSMSSVYVWTLYENALTCSLRVWPLQFGWSLMFASLAIKATRIWIVSRSTLDVPRIRVETLLFALGALLAVELGLTAVWQGVAPFHVETAVVDPNRPALNYERCGADDPDAVLGFTVAALAFKFVVVFVAAAAAWRTRHVRSEFNESTHIGAAVWVTACVMVIAIPVVATSDDRVFAYYVRSFGLLLLNVLTISCVFIPKLLAIRAYPATVPIQHTKPSAAPAPQHQQPLHRVNGNGDAHDGDGLVQLQTLPHPKEPGLTGVAPSHLNGKAVGERAPALYGAPCDSQGLAMPRGRGDELVVASGLVGPTGLQSGDSTLSGAADLDLRARNGLLDRLLDEAFHRFPEALADLKALRARMPVTTGAAPKLTLDDPAGGTNSTLSAVHEASGRAAPVPSPQAKSGMSTLAVRAWGHSALPPPLTGAGVSGAAPLSSIIQLSDAEDVRGGGGGGGYPSLMSSQQSGATTRSSALVGTPTTERLPHGMNGSLTLPTTGSTTGSSRTEQSKASTFTPSTTSTGLVSVPVLVPIDSAAPLTARAAPPVPRSPPHVMRPDLVSAPAPAVAAPAAAAAALPGTLPTPVPSHLSTGHSSLSP